MCLFALPAQELHEEQECVIHPPWGLLEKPPGPGAALHLQVKHELLKAVMVCPLVSATQSQPWLLV